VARVTLNGKLLVDDFYNGNALDVGLRRYAPEILNADLEIAVLPLRKDAPIFMAPSARPDFGAAGSVVDLQGIEIIPHYQLQVTAR
jgi:beta-galactosidase